MCPLLWEPPSEKAVSGPLWTTIGELLDAFPECESPTYLTNCGYKLT
jgi:hypothetical protein